jgi:hypothetical protein
MRKALIGILMAATIATPLAAQENERGWRGNRAERSESRGEQRQQRQEQRQAREQAAAPQQAQQQAAQQQQVQQRSRGEGGQRQQWQGNQNAQADSRNWQGRGDSSRQGYEQRVQESREASRRSAEGVTPSYQRQAARNQQRYEQQLRQGDRQDRRGDRYRDDRRDNDRNWNNGRDNGGRDWRNGRDGRSSNAWNRSWRNDNRYDWQRYRYSNRNVFRRGAYYAPYRNYSYNRLGIGVVLDSLFFGRNYWISDPYSYRLPASPPGTQWVRYYDDVVLVDVYSGEVLDVIYDFFW